MRALLLCLLALTSPAAAFEVVSVGIRCPEVPQGERVEAPGTELGWIREGMPTREYDIAGTYVPAEANLAFGMRFRVPDDLEPGTVGEMVLYHPPMGASGVTRQSHPTRLVPGAVQGVNWIFEFDYERVQGTWVRTLEVDGKEVLRVTFTVGPPGTSTLVNEVCFRAAPMS